MGYKDPCQNDPQHEPAVVGINPPPNAETESWWVCMACFEEYLGQVSALVDGVLRVATS